MSEYWKSTPKYWCKFCKLFVKDTKLERQQHDATPRHQGNIQRSLRGLHKEKEIEDRQKQRAKDEVARLNGVVGADPSKSAGSGGHGLASAGGRGADAPKKATLEERKRQMQQLADMGVAIPEEFRKEMGMAGDWQTIAITKVDPPPKEEDSKEAAAFGIRKRKFEDQEEEEAILGTGEAAPRKNRQWGARMKVFPGDKSNGVSDLDSLLGGIAVKRYMKDASDRGDGPQDTASPHAHTAETDISLKKSGSQEEQEAALELAVAPPLDVPMKTEEASAAAADIPGAGIVFKKRKKVLR